MIQVHLLIFGSCLSKHAMSNTLKLKKKKKKKRKKKIQGLNFYHWWDNYWKSRDPVHDYHHTVILQEWHKPTHTAHSQPPLFKTGGSQINVLLDCLCTSHHFGIVVVSQIGVWLLQLHDVISPQHMWVKMRACEKWLRRIGEWGERNTLTKCISSAQLTSLSWGGRAKGI